MGWSQLLRNDILKIADLGVIRSHPTELPKYRGRAPIPWTIIKELPRSALTFFYIEEGIDNGDILDQVTFEINPDDDATTVYEKVTSIGCQMILRSLKQLADGTAQRRKQDDDKFIENWPKRTPEDGKIDWSKPAKEIHNLIRATSPYPGAFTIYKNNKLKIWASSYLDDELSEPGKILEIEENSVSRNRKRDSYYEKTKLRR